MGAADTSSTEELGSWPESFTQEHHGVYLFWHYLAVATATMPWPIATAVVAAIALAAKKHRRAAIWTVGVMASVMIATAVIKRARRARRARCGTTRSR